MSQTSRDPSTGRLEPSGIVVALPVWGGRISPVFDAAGHLLVVEAEGGMEVDRREVPLEDGPLPSRARRLSELGVDVLICGAISRTLVDLLEDAGIKVVPWISGEPDPVLAAYLEGGLPDSGFTMPGCRGTRERRRSGHRGGGTRRGRGHRWS
jgi:predicted Fe-Mo cluster-binding NifX family protein